MQHPVIATGMAILSLFLRCIQCFEGHLGQSSNHPQTPLLPPSEFGSVGRSMMCPVPAVRILPGSPPCTAGVSADKTGGTRRPGALSSPATDHNMQRR